MIEPECLAIKVLRSGKASNARDHLSSVGIDVIGRAFPLFEGDQVVGCVSIFNKITKVVELSRELQRTKGVADYLQDQLNQRTQLPLSFKEYVGQNSRTKTKAKLRFNRDRIKSSLNLREKYNIKKDKGRCARMRSDLFRILLLNYMDLFYLSYPESKGFLI